MYVSTSYRENGMYLRAYVLNNHAPLQAYLVRGTAYQLSMDVSVAGTQQYEKRKVHCSFFNNCIKNRYLYEVHLDMMVRAGQATQ